MKEKQGNPGTGLGWRAIAALTLSGLLVIALFSGHAPLWLSVPYLVMGFCAFGLYWADKRRAAQGQRRISEVALLGADLIFGVIGGLLGQQLFRHKTRKTSYALRVLVITVLHGLWLASFAAGSLVLK